MGIGTDTNLVVAPILGFLSGRQLSFYPLLPRFVITITDLILLTITMSMSGMIEFGSQGIGNIEVAPTVREEFGFLATGNGDRIEKDT